MSCVSYAHLDSKISTCLEMERKKEVDRRRKLRLLQVRQQSNDLANKLREDIKAEHAHIKNKLFESERKHFEKRQLDKFKQLEEMYQSCLHTVGESHREAAKHPSVNLIKQMNAVKIKAEAAVRGAKARKKQLEKEALHCHQIAAPIMQKKQVRNRENLRSLFISSLPKHTAISGNHKVPPQKSLHSNSETTKRLQIQQEIPSNLLNQQPCLKPSLVDDKHQDTGKTVTQKTGIKLNVEYQNENKKQKLKIANECNKLLGKSGSVVESTDNCSCHLIICSCHDSTTRKLKRTWNSESNISSEISSEVGDLENKTVRLKSRSCSPPSVKTLNYLDTGNFYESNQRSFARVIRHLDSPKATQRNTSEINELCTEQKYRSEELNKKTQERSEKALQREQLKREFHQLLQDLGSFTREKLMVKRRTKSRGRVYQRERDILIKKEDKQKKLVDTFNTLLHIVKVEKSHSKGLSQTIQLHETDDSSPPTLNLAEYQQINMSRETSPFNPSLVRRITSTEVTTIETSTPQRTGRHSRKSSPSRSPPERTPPHSADSASRQMPSHQFILPSENSQVTSKADEHGAHKKKCKRSKKSPTPDSSTSYYSPPENLTPSQKLLLDALLIQVNKEALSEDLRKYIKKLLTMSRESIDELDQSSPGYIDPTRSPPEKAVYEDMAKLSDLTELYAEKVNLLVDLFQSVGETLEPEDLFEPEHLRSYQGPQAESLSSQQRPKVPPPPKVQIAVRKPQQAGGQCPQLSLPRCPPTAQSSLPRRTTPQSSVPRRAVPQSSLPSRMSPQPATFRSGSPQSSSSRSTTPQPPGGVKRTQSRERGIPRRTTTPPMGKSRQTQSTRISSPRPQQIMPQPVYPEGRTQLPPSRPQRQTAPQCSGIQTPFGLSSNLLPHPRDVFEQADHGTQNIPQGQNDPITISECPDRQRSLSPKTMPGIPECPDRQRALSPKTMPGVPRSPERHMEPCSQITSGNCTEDEDSMAWMFEDMPDYLKVGPVRDARAIIQQFNPDMPSFTDDSSYDLSADLRRHGLDDKFEHLRKFYKDPADQRFGDQSCRDTDRVSLDTTLDADAATYPLNIERINELRRKLSKIHDNQYREVLKMLQEDYDSDQGRFDVLLKQVRSDPFQDPNDTLAPVGYVSPRAPPCEQTPDTLPYISLEKNTTRLSQLDNKIDNITALSILASSQEQFD